jgi:hypothetical protein
MRMSIAAQEVQSRGVDAVTTTLTFVLTLALIAGVRGYRGFHRGEKPRGLSALATISNGTPMLRRFGILTIPLNSGVFREWFMPLPFHGVLCVTWRPLRDEGTA